MRVSTLHRLALMVLVGALAMTTTGCWDRLDVENLAVATTVALDLPPQGEGILLTATYFIPRRAAGGAGGMGGGGASGLGTPFVRASAGPEGPAAWVVGVRAPTLPEAQEALVQLTSREPIWSHLRVIVLGESLASRGIGAVVDALTRSREFRLTSWVVVARGVAAHRLLELPGPFTPASQHLAVQQQVLQRRSGASAVQRLHTFLLAYESPGVDPVAPAVSVESAVQPDPELIPESPPAAALVVQDGTAVFREDRLVGWLTADESRALLLLRGESPPFVIGAACPDGSGRLAVSILRATTRRRWEAQDAAPASDGPAGAAQGVALPTAVVEVSMDGAIAARHCEGPLDVETNRRLEESVARKLEESMRQTLDRLHREMRADPVGFGLALSRDRPQLWRQVEREWREHLATLPVDVRVELRIRRPQLTTGEAEPR